MPRYCAITGCLSRDDANEKQISYHFLKLKDLSLYKHWIAAIIVHNNQDITNLPKSSVICSKHFTSNSFLPGLVKRLKVDAIPSIFSATKDMEDVEYLDPTSDERIPLSTLSMNTMESSYNIPTTSVINTEIIKTPTRKPRRYYPGDFSNNDSTPRRLISALNRSLMKSRRTIKRLRSQNVRQKINIRRLNVLFTSLKKKNLISEDADEVLQSICYDEKNILLALSKGKVHGKYPPELRTFALTLHFYSPKAYRYVRSVYKTQLPAPSTIRAWYSHVDGAPGFTTEALDALKIKIKMLAEKGKEMVACLIFDEMAIRRHIEWNHKNKKYVGVVDVGTSLPETEELPVAKDALVFLLTGVNDRWKIPVAYFLVNGLNSSERASITKQILEFLAPSGVKIVALIFDGFSANLGMCHHLGANIKERRPCFKHPVDRHNIFILLDACHCVKLIRNTLASKKTLLDDENRLVKWEYIDKLVRYQENLGVHLANKLTSKHIMWEKNKMNVKIAAQTLSESTAISLQQLVNDRHPEFIGAEATINFIIKINNIFDSLNSRSLYSYNFKRPINGNTNNFFFNFFNNEKQYLENLKLLNGQVIVNSANKTGFIGFIILMNNFQNIYNEYVVNKKWLNYILTYKFSQDHLEIFFSCIRSMGGYNSNPTATQFAASYKKLLMHNEVKSSAEANCMGLDETNILFVSSKRIVSQTDSVENEDDVEAIEIDNIPISYIDSSFQEPLVYVAGFAERNVIKKIKCETCIELLNRCEPHKSSFIELKSYGNLRFPRKDTVKVCETVQKIINLLKIDNKIKNKNVYQIIIVNTFKNINLSSIFESFNDHVLECEVLENHKYLLIKILIEIFSKVHLFHIGKQYSLKEHKTYIRQNLSKYIHFMGQ